MTRIPTLAALLHAALLCGALCGTAQPSHAGFDRAQAIGLSASVLKVEALRVQGGYSVGSGVVVGQDRVATNCHVTREARAIHIVRGGQRWAVVAQAADLLHDLCVLQVPGVEAQAVPLGASSTLSLGQNTLALGYTGGVELQHSFGDIVGLSSLGSSLVSSPGSAPGSAPGQGDAPRVIQLRNGFNSGASGGGLFDEQLRLIGILTFRLRGGASHYFAAPTDWLLPLLADGAAYEPVAPLQAQALPFWQQPASAQPLFLQAAVLQREQRWQELAGLATRWAQAAPADAQAPFMQALAWAGLKRWQDAQQALERALKLAPDFQDAWYQLGLAQQALGHLDHARRALARLQALDSTLALPLEHALQAH